MSREIRVLVWATTASPFGGHVVQLTKTAESLSRLDGVTVRIATDSKPDWTGIDVVHGFGVEHEDVREARRRRIPVCLSVIYWSKAYRTGLLAREAPWRAALRRARMMGVLSVAALRGRHISKSEALARHVIETTALFESADLLLPNSQLEAEAIVRDLGVTTPLRVVPNAVDIQSFGATRPWHERDGVLYVGRLEPHKNQLRLITALHGTGVPLTIVGGDHPDHPEYARAVRAHAGPDVRVVGHVPHDDLGPLYASARVHAMPSLFETTGLASLEAAAAGCNVVTTRLGYASEYLEDLAWYCDPYDENEIRSAVLEALAAAPQDVLRRRILQRYTWAHAAAATLQAYHDLLDCAL